MINNECSKMTWKWCFEMRLIVNGTELHITCYIVPCSGLLLSIAFGASARYRTGAPGPCCQFSSGVRVAHLLFCFVRIILVILFSLLWVSAFPVWSLSLDYILLISALILVFLIMLSTCTLTVFISSDSFAPLLF